jgi:hypothetical protein
MKWIVLIVAVLAVTGCDQKGVPETSATVGVGASYTIDKLFKYDGCTVYRFRDAGYNRYFTNCSGSTIGTDSESCGKNCTNTWDTGISGGARR